jgi:hypothetical protein
MTQEHPSGRTDANLGGRFSNQTPGEPGEIDLDQYCDDPDTGIGNVSVGFDGEPGDLTNELRSIFGAHRRIEPEE